MTRYEYIKGASFEEIAELLCNITDNTALPDEPSTERCEQCLAYKYCTANHNGFLNWLNQEVIITKNCKGVQVWDD